ncbi:MAG: Holliday junction resolvase RuvX [Gammaproteobacteria bacterium]|nr:Holliday junction resolvase RuvX [Gammaproteobacteria bacterium]
MSNHSGSVVAFDFGLSQIGVATGNARFSTSQPLPILKAKDGIPDWHAVQALLATWQPEKLIVGDPINMDDSVSELAERARKFARRLHGRFGLEVIMVDERLSSQAAKSAQFEGGHKGDFKRHPVDSYAAELLLHTWFEAARSEEDTG